MKHIATPFFRILSALLVGFVQSIVLTFCIIGYFLSLIWHWNNSYYSYFFDKETFRYYLDGEWEMASKADRMRRLAKKTFMPYIKPVRKYYRHPIDALLDRVQYTSDWSIDSI